jgi:hypothetical protein
MNGRDHVKELSADRRIILSWICRNKSGRMWTAYIWLRIGSYS